MSDREALIQSIIDNPNEDTARLVYADWQDEHGDPAHAELIRLQCRLAQLPEADPERAALTSRESALLARPENAAMTARGGAFTRGFVENMDWYGDPDPLDFDAAPVERVLSLNASVSGDSWWPEEATAVRLAASPGARRLRSLAYHDLEATPGILRALAASPHLLNLREVLFSDGVASPEALVDLLLAPAVRGIEVLTLQGETNGWDGMAGPLARFLADPRAARLRQLHLLALGLTDEIVDVLLASKGLEGTRVSLCNRQDWLTPPVRAALQARFGTALEFERNCFVGSNTTWY